MLKRLTLLCSLCLLSACQTDNTSDIDTNTEQAVNTAVTEKKITKVIVEKQAEEVKEWQQGQLVFIELEGGFYGIISSTGEKLLPLNLSEVYFQTGATIRFQAEKLNHATIQQWGSPVNILAIELIKQVESKNSTH